MTALVAATIDELRSLLGRELGPTPWRVVSQEMIDDFARLSGDSQWIHVDPARAQRESPWRSTVAHGDLLLALTGGFRDQLRSIDGFDVVVNRGWRSVVFESSVPAGEAVRGFVTLTELNPLDGDWHELVERHVLAKHGGVVCTAESVSWLLRAVR